MLLLCIISHNSSSISLQYVFTSHFVMFNHSLMQLCKQLCACRHGQVDLLKIKPSIKMVKKGDFTDFEHCIVVVARLSGFSISETGDLLGFFINTVGINNKTAQVNPALYQGFRLVVAVQWSLGYFLGKL